MKIILIILSALFLFNFSKAQSLDKSANKIPMYGNIKKSEGQLWADRKFIRDCESIFNSRAEAASNYLNKGWEYFYQGYQDSAIMRFNQAWLLDSLNADIYWGFGNVLGKQMKHKESIIHFEKSLKLNPNNAHIFENAATSYIQLFFKTNNTSYLHKSIDYFYNSLELDNNNPRVLAKLTKAKLYLMNNSQEQKYLNMAAPSVLEQAYDVSKVDQPPIMLYKPPPIYPRSLHKEGTVVVEAVISEKGDVIYAHVLESIPSLDEMCIEAAMNSSYKPAIHKGKQVKVKIRMPFHFTVRH